MTGTPEITTAEDRLVWYAGYGSNLLRRRFECYIYGGTPEGSTRKYPGCRDKTPPRGDQQIRLGYQLYFANYSEAWGGAIAFIRRAASDAVTYARMYLISYGQFNDVVRQENQRKVPGKTIVPSYDELADASEWSITDLRVYDRLIVVGTQDAHPILTFSTTHNDFALGAPSEVYINMIVAGLEETYPCLRKSEIIEYLGEAEGIHDVIQRDVLAHWVLDR